MAVADKSLAKELAAAKKAPRNFAVIPGKDENALLVSRKPIPPGQVKAARSEVGGTKVYRGRCFLEDGVLVFETMGNPPADLARRIRETAREGQPQPPRRGPPRRGSPGNRPRGRDRGR